MKSSLLSIFVLPFVLLLSAAQAEPTIQTFDSKAAFLSATRATDATGPLPDLGFVSSSLNPTFTTVGTLTFSLVPTGDGVINTLFIGASGTTRAPDWYPLRPGNELAPSYQRIQVQTAAPVYSFGFEMVEPNATASPGDGAPGPSPFVVTLFSGANAVGQFVIDVPDDVVAFVGVWSDTSFDRVTIVDSTGYHDNEFFGQFYTGTLAGPSRSFIPIAGSGVTVPGGSGGVFTAFAESPVVGAGAASFLGLGSACSFGIYSRSSATPTGPLRIADLNTAIPGGTGTFTQGNRIKLKAA